MERREFLKQACGAGLCGCAIASLFAPTAALAADEPKPAAPPETKPTPPPSDDRIRFAQDRYAKLLGALSQRVEPTVLSDALQDVGRFCASHSPMLTTFAGKPDAFLAFIREKWNGQAERDATTGVVTIAFPPLGECPCPLVRKGMTPGTVCECSLGWQKQAFSVVFGRPVEVKLKGSLLRGADRCSFEIRPV